MSNRRFKGESELGLDWCAFRRRNIWPLRFAKDRSIPERLSKWRRRNPRVLVGMVVAAVLGFAGGAGAWAHQQHERVAAAAAVARAENNRQALDGIRLDLVLPASETSARHDRGTGKALEILRGYGLPEDSNWRQRAPFLAIPQAQREQVAAPIGVPGGQPGRADGLAVERRDRHADDAIAAQ